VGNRATFEFWWTYCGRYGKSTVTSWTATWQLGLQGLGAMRDVVSEATDMIDQTCARQYYDNDNSQCTPRDVEARRMLRE
jgi:hypothetical protein